MIPPRPADFDERVQGRIARILADQPRNDAPIRIASPPWRDYVADTPDIPVERDFVVTCGQCGARHLFSARRTHSCGGAR